MSLALHSDVPAPSPGRPAPAASPMPAAPLGRARRPPLHVAAVWGPPLVVVMLVAVVLVAANRQNDARRWVAHTHDVLLAARATLGHVQDAETGQRGYLLTGAPAYRTPYDSARGALAADTARLRTLTRDNAVQQARLNVLAPRLAAKFAELDTTVRLRAAGDSAGALAVVRADGGRQLMGQIRDEVNAITAEEERLLAVRQRREDDAAAALVVAVLAGGLAAGVLAVVANQLLASAAARVDRAARAESARAEGLAIAQARLQHQRGELVTANRQLEERAVELERQLAALRIGASTAA